MKIGSFFTNKHFFAIGSFLLKNERLLLTRSVVSDSWRPHGLQHVRPSCPSPSPGACSNSCPSSRGWHPAISSSVVPFSSCLQSFLASGSFFNELTLLISWPAYWSFSISPSSEYLGLISFRIDWFLSPCIPGDSQESSTTPQFKSVSFSMLVFLYGPTLTSIHDY